MSSRARAIPVLNGGRVFISGNQYVAFRVAVQMLGNDEDGMLRWVKTACPWIGRRLRSKTACVQDGPRRLTMRLYLEADVEEVLRSKREGAVGAPPHHAKV